MVCNKPKGWNTFGANYQRTFSIPYQLKYTAGKIVSVINTGIIHPSYTYLLLREPKTASMGCGVFMFGSGVKKYGPKGELKFSISEPHVELGDILSDGNMLLALLSQDGFSILSFLIFSQNGTLLRTIDIPVLFGENYSAAQYSICCGKYIYIRVAKKNNSDVMFAKLTMDGEVIWFNTYSSLGAHSVLMPYLSNDKHGNLYSIFIDGEVLKISPDGDVIWHTGLRGGLAIYPVTVDDRENIYFGMGPFYWLLPNATYSLDRDGNVRWTVDTTGFLSNLSLGPRGCLNYVDQYGKVVHVNNNGEVLWARNVFDRCVAGVGNCERGYTTITGIDGAILSVVERGKMVLLSENGEILWAKTLPLANGEKVYNLLTGPGRQIYVQTNIGRIFVLR